MGVSGPVVWEFAAPDGTARQLTLDRPSALGSHDRRVGATSPRDDRPDVVFTGAAVLLLLMRSYDLTAGLCVLALAFSAVGGGGPLLGAERVAAASCIRC